MPTLSAISGVVVAVAAVVVAGVLRAALTPVLGVEGVPFLTFFPAIALAACMGALFLVVASVLAAAVANYYWVLGARALAAGFDMHLVKPVDPEALTAALS